jgi:hypothetical protein
VSFSHSRDDKALRKRAFIFKYSILFLQYSRKSEEYSITSSE